MGKIYFAHPVNIYGEPLEAAFEKLIAHYLTNGDMGLVENPNRPHHQDGYNRRATRKKESGTDDNPMAYFYEEVLPQCYGCAAVPFLDHRFGGGVAGEAKWYVERDKPVSVVVPLYPTPTLSEIQDFVENPLGGLFFVRVMTDEEKHLLLSGDSQLVISREETRLRTWKVYNKVRRPYEEAHLVSMPVPEGFYPQG